MDVRDCIKAKAQIKKIELQRRSVIQNMLGRCRTHEISVGKSTIKRREQKELCENSKHPRFVTRPVDISVLPHQTGIIEARISGSPQPEVKWYKNGQRIAKLTHPRIKTRHYEPDVYVLEIQNVTTYDMGSYTCVARNFHGGVTSSATVRIAHSEIEEHPRFLKRLQCTDLYDGQSCRLEVRVTGVPKPEVKWFKNWMPLKENNRIEIRRYDNDTYVLSIYHAKPEDEGLYTCRVRNCAGTRTTSAMIHVEGSKNLRIYKPLARLPHEFLSDNEWSEELTRILRRIEKLEGLSY